VTSGGNIFNDFPNNQLTEVRVYIGLSRIFTPPPLNFYEASRFGMDAPDRQRTDKQTDMSLCKFDCFFVSWMESDT